MPTYDYSCARCGDLEIFQSIKAEPLTQCPGCGSKRFRKQVQRGGGVIFKGSGFWETDYNRSSDYSSKAKAETSGPTTKAETKTATTDSAAKPSTAPTPAKSPAKPATPT